MSLKFLNQARQTIGLRLALGFLTIFILSSLILFVLTYVFLYLSIQKKDKEIIKTEFKECKTEYEKGGVSVLQKEVEFDKRASGKNPFFIRIAGPKNNTVFLNIPNPWIDLDLKTIENVVIKGNEKWSYMQKKEGGDIFEVVSDFLPDGYHLQVGKSIADRQELLERFRVIFAIIMIVVIFIGFTGGAFFAFHELRPIRHMISTIRSIIDTSKVDARMPMRQRNDELDELSRLFNLMLEKIQTLIIGMREGLDNVAHDLRTPITRLRGTAELALQSEQNSSDILREALGECIEESEHIISMLKTIMDISEAETGVMKLVLEEVNINKLIEEIVELYGYVAEEKNISIHKTFREELYLIADGNRLRQIFANLLDNAIKCTSEGGKIDIETFEADQQIVVITKDTGIGISPEELPKIWERLYRGDKSRSEPGLGLGLSLVKAIVQAHKGYIEVSSKPGAGSLFAVYLPKIR